MSDEDPDQAAPHVDPGRWPLSFTVVLVAIAASVALSVLTTARWGTALLTALLAAATAVRGLGRDRGSAVLRVRSRRTDLVVLGTLTVVVGVLTALLPSS